MPGWTNTIPKPQSVLVGREKTSDAVVDTNRGESRDAWLSREEILRILHCNLLARLNPRKSPLLHRSDVEEEKGNSMPARDATGGSFRSI